MSEITAEISHEENKLLDETSEDENKEAVASINAENQNMDFEEDFRKVQEEIRDVGSMPKIRHKKKPVTSEPEVSQKFGQSGGKRKGLSLSELLNNNVKTAAMDRPVDLNTIEGQRDIAARRDRELKQKAKAECIEKFNSISQHKIYWPVNK